MNAPYSTQNKNTYTINFIFDFNANENLMNKALAWKIHRFYKSSLLICYSAYLSWRN